MRRLAPWLLVPAPAALLARSGRGPASGDPAWRALGSAGLAPAPRLRAAARGAAFQLATTLALFAPFLAGAHTFDYRWTVGSGTLLAHVVAPGTRFGWPLRIAQASLAVAVAAL